MGRRPGPVEIIWKHGDAAFAFLFTKWNFLGPERTDSGIAFHRPDLHVVNEIWAWKNETGFDTTLRWTDPVTGKHHRPDWTASTLHAASARRNTSPARSAGPRDPSVSLSMATHFDG
jgi:hypothetical protein